VNCLENKYKRWHDSIIEKAKNRNLTGYKEIHHIIPKSLGGTNHQSNLIALTAKEHYIIHMLLPFFLEGEEKHKMLCAFTFMLGKNKFMERKHKIHSRLYEKLRTELSNSSKGKKLSRETKLKLSRAHRGKKLSAKTKMLIKFKRKFQVVTKEQRKRYSEIYSNLIWVNKDGLSKRIKPEMKNVFLQKGFVLGRDLSYITDAIRKNLSNKTTDSWKRRKACI